VRQLDATIAGVVLIFALAYLDAAWEGTVIAATVVIGPFLTAIFASVRNTALVAGLVTRMVLFPAGALVEVPLWVRLGAFAGGVALYLLLRRNVAAGVGAAAVLLMAVQFMVR